ncbi:MAG: UDP-N-acetylglucosamine--N-acetylmuramyl-(pentapeptide) pyrophosphoryl-undecaprenol N-acetylglucosamine transferase, partial [Bacteroidia bacterium]|nr:UDP-N-acetylglucosamine--N-acetylmuramyl-(pentapeptide) pyrophosphoryl-undecaprenol N-acetylglucosamine transferase [Bacteroidia bacterium]
MSLVIAAGGTGGHVFPALAIAQKWREKQPDEPIYWIGVKGGRERRWVEAAELPFYGIPMAGWQPRDKWRNFSLLYLLPYAAWHTYRLLNKLKPKVIFTTGGYPGLVPGLIGRMQQVPLVLLELNLYAGRTVRWLTRWAQKVCGAFPEIHGLEKVFSYEWVGVPVRFHPSDKSFYSSERAKSQLGFCPHKPLVLILGGSQGSSALNRMVGEVIPLWLREGISVLWQVGGGGETIETPKMQKVSFIEDMRVAYAAAEVVVSRAGGSTLGEIAWWSKAAVLVPSPYVAEDHQRKNAYYWARKGAA